MIQVKNAFRFISIRLANFSLNSTYTQMYKESNVASVYRNTLDYIRLGYTENESIVRTLVEMHIMTIDQVKIINTFQTKPNCSNEKGHKFGTISGKCTYCDILGCKYGFINHKFGNISGKCSYCDILGCSIGLNDHKFGRISGKCQYCNLMGCVTGLKDHQFGNISGKCQFCDILGCQNGFINHNFGKFSETCSFCGIEK